MDIHHISGEVLLKYFSNKLTKKDRQDVYGHLKDCVVCKLKLSFIENKYAAHLVGECKSISPVLASYVKGELQSAVMKKVRGHLNACNACNDAYIRLLEEHDQDRKHTGADIFNLSDLKWIRTIRAGRSVKAIAYKIKNKRNRKQLRPNPVCTFHCLRDAQNGKK
jgi:hypothetical protein